MLVTVLLQNMWYDEPNALPWLRCPKLLNALLLVQRIDFIAVPAFWYGAMLWLHACIRAVRNGANTMMLDPSSHLDFKLRRWISMWFFRYACFHRKLLKHRFGTTSSHFPVNFKFVLQRIKTIVSEKIINSFLEKWIIFPSLIQENYWKEHIMINIPIFCKMPSLIALFCTI